MASDADELDSYIWRLDAPYEKQATALGGLQVAVRGRVALALLVFLEKATVQCQGGPRGSA